LYNKSGVSDLPFSLDIKLFLVYTGSIVFSIHRHKHIYFKYEIYLIVLFCSINGNSVYVSSSGKCPGLDSSELSDHLN
jgi:hypothetical protein